MMTSRELLRSTLKPTSIITKILFVIILTFLFVECKTNRSAESNTGVKEQMDLVNSPSVPSDGKEESRRVINKWLPEEENVLTNSSEIDNFLKTINGKIRLLHCKYEGANLVETKNFKREGLQLNDEEWRTAINTNVVEADPIAMDINIQFLLENGSAKEAGIAVAYDFSNWDTENYVMFPASVYNGNRCKLVDRAYASGLDRKYLYKKDIPLMSVPIPQLSLSKDAISRLEVNASNMATPAMCFFSKKEKRGFIVLSRQKSQFADNGFIVEEGGDRKVASFVISAPGVRERKPAFVGFTESTDRSADFKAGDQIDMQLRIYSFKADDIPALLEKFMEVRKAVTGKNSPRNLIPFSQVASWMTERIDSRWYAGDEFQFYCPENANWISFGWIGGLMNTYPMLN